MKFHKSIYLEGKIIELKNYLRRRMNEAVNNFINSKSIAVVGYSRNGKKFGNIVYNELSKKNYTLFPVNPYQSEIEGVKCYPNLTSIEAKVDGAFIAVPSTQAIPVLEEAHSLGIKNIWIQRGAESDGLINFAVGLGLNIVTGKCILMYAQPVKSIHAFHRAIVKLFGKL